MRTKIDWSKVASAFIQFLAALSGAFFGTM